MKPKTTWVLLADAKRAFVLQYDQKSKQLEPVSDACWIAAPPAEYSDEAGITPSRGGAGRASITRPDPAVFAEAHFAKEVVINMAQAQSGDRFDRLIVVAAPHMLGCLRSQFTPALKAAIVDELDRDLTRVEPKKVLKSLASVLPL